MLRHVAENMAETRNRREETLDDGSYFIRRAEEEALAAAQASCAKARDAHRDLAQRYRELGLQLAIYDIEPAMVIPAGARVAVSTG